MIGHYNSIVNYYRDIHRLKTHGGYSVLEINSMIPYEMEIYAMQVLKDLQDAKNNKG